MLKQYGSENCYTICQRCPGNFVDVLKRKENTTFSTGNDALSDSLEWSLSSIILEICSMVYLRRSGIVRGAWNICSKWVYKYLRLYFFQQLISLTRTVSQVRHTEMYFSYLQSATKPFLDTCSCFRALFQTFCTLCASWCSALSKSSRKFTGFISRQVS